MTIGTKSVLLGAHQFIIHPFFVLIAWIKLYGFPVDPRLWFAFFLHDIGYIGKSNMDGKEGESHPETGAAIMGELAEYMAQAGDKGKYKGEVNSPEVNRLVNSDSAKDWHRGMCLYLQDWAYTNKNRSSPSF
jgi:hypothetical protein